mmetsp:Transcript_22712/g.38363  ORF Transcript_22712/g.38363 Transcript_22712/m.38363 type:complete len:104 (+) Transcript_22712:325-636(+)
MQAIIQAERALMWLRNGIMVADQKEIKDLEDSGKANILVLVAYGAQLLRIARRETLEDTTLTQKARAGAGSTASEPRPVANSNKNSDSPLVELLFVLEGSKFN